MAPGSPDLLAFDREHLWHPYTSLVDPTPVRLITGADGVRLQVAGHGEVIDGMSSWWAAIHGYRHPVLDAALAAQAHDFAHVMFGGLTHEPAIRAAQALVDLTPPGLDRVFWADSGSVSVEVALKVALQYQRGLGFSDRTRILTVRGGYHGDTFGAMSVCDPVGGMHSMFAGVLPTHVFADQPPAPGGDVAGWAAAFRALADAHHHDVAAIIVEPRLQGAGGMHVYDAACLQVMREVADHHGFLLIFDEIATGFGRTGTLWGGDGVAPDVMCVGKALTGGYLTLAAMVCTDVVSRGVAGSEAGVLMHGPTFMGNPLACAVAQANLGLIASGAWESDVARIGAALEHGLAPVAEFPGVRGVRTMGAVGVVQLDHPVNVVAATEAALAAGVWVRPFRDLIYTMPPYIASTDEVAQICAAITRAAEVG